MPQQQSSVLVIMLMQVRVTVHEFLVPMGVFVDKVSPEKEIRVGKELLRLPVSNKVMVGPQDNYPTGQLIYCVQVLSAEN